MTSQERLHHPKRENLLYRWGLAVRELTEIVDANPSMGGLMPGYVAEHKLRKMHFEDPRITALVKDDDHGNRRAAHFARRRLSHRSCRPQLTLWERGAEE